jgi:hypothetical protein
MLASRETPRFLRITALLTLLFMPGTTVAGEFQPDYLKFGSVRVGAIVEGSVRIFREGVDASGLAVKVVPPAFVKVGNIEIGSQTYGPEARGFCDISVSVDTGREGDHSGVMRVEIGGQRVEIPVGVSVLPRKADSTRVLVAETPFQKFSSEDATIFAAWLRLVEGADLDVYYLEVRRGSPVLRDLDLAAFDVVLLGQGGLVHLLDSDVENLKRFAGRGGRIVVSANAFYVGTVAKANELLTPYGLRMIDTEPQGASEFDLGADAILAHSLTGGIRSLYFHRPSPTTVTDRSKGKLLVTAPVYPGEGFVAMAQAGDGEVIALGESLWWSWVNKADNSLLMRNLLKKPGRRK